MGDKVILAVADMLLPLTMLGLGLVIWLTRPPYNDLFGYRTTLSQKNALMWERAQYLFGKLCTVTFAVLSFLTLIAGIVPIIGKFDKYATSFVAMLVTFVDTIALMAVIFVVEGKLKREFDKDGNPRGGGV